MPPPSETPRLFLIDGSSQMYRAYHGIPALTAPDGSPTNAVYGFVTTLRKLIADHEPALIAAAFDLRGPTFRSQIDVAYKANRAPMPADLAPQVPLVHEACEALGVPVVTAETFEADDVIGTLATRAAGEGFDVVIVTGDKDFFQLVDGPIRVFNPRDAGTWFDAAAVTAKMGVAPTRIVDLLALMGDSVDNIKGVPGIGRKGAVTLIQTFGSLDELLARTAEVPQKRYRTALLEHAADARHSRSLLVIRTDAPVPFEPDRLRYRGPDRERCMELFTRLDFQSLKADFAPTAATVSQRHTLVKTLDELNAVIDAVRAAGRCGLHAVVDVPPARARVLVGIALAAARGQAHYVALGPDAPLDAGAARECLRPLLEDPAILKIGHDVKAVRLALAAHDLAVDGFDGDTMLMSYLLDATRSSHDFEDLVLEQLNYRAVTAEDLCGKGAAARAFADLPAAAPVDLAGERAAFGLQLFDRLRSQLQAAGLASLYDDLERPLIPVLLSLERTGVRVDADVLQALSRQLGAELAERQAAIHAAAGIEFNINSPRQLGKVLFERLRLPTLRRTGKTRAASTSMEVLEELARDHALPRMVLEWRSLQKLKGTYLDALPQLIDPRTGRIHTSFQQAIAATGRLSSRDPNLQNIPVRTARGRDIRRAFTAAPGYRLVAADYSQIELRVLAHLAHDEALIAAFRRGDDIHDQTARRVFGPDSGLDPHELRRRAKIVNYALLYGKTAFTLARDIGVTPAQAQDFIHAYFAGFPGVRRYLDEVVARGRETGVVTTLFGRRRFVPDLASPNAARRAAAERIAVNMPIQGTAADILKRAMIDLHTALPAGALMILTVHDELVVEVPEAAAETVAELVRERMECAARLAVPLTVDIGIGRTWAEAKA